MEPAPLVYCFVSEENFPEFLRVCEDRETMATEYATFSQCIDDFHQSVQQQGGRAVRVYIEPIELVRWCRATGRKVDSNGRSAYAAHVFLRGTKTG
jgi:hypothetical protein